MTDEAAELKMPSLSIIVPTWGDPKALTGTLNNILAQSPIGRNLDIEVLVCGDGFEGTAKNFVADANTVATNRGLGSRFFYFHTDVHNGTGNIARNLGLQKAMKDWVLFLDAGTGVAFRCLEVVAEAAAKNPDAWLISWDMWQNMDPVPVTTTVHAFAHSDRSQGLPYIFPGCATAVRRDVGQSIEWPNVPPSDWAYFSQLWDNRYGEFENEDPEVIDREVILIQWCLTCAYQHRTTRKWRMPIETPEQFAGPKFNMGWSQAQELSEQPVDSAADSSAA